MYTTKPRTDTTSHARVSGGLPAARLLVWAGSLEHGRSSFCPRCGSASRTGTPVGFSLPAV